jgi:hypothetical protein
MRRAEKVALHARQIGEPLTREQLLWRPAKRRWSAGECFEHLTIIGTLYNERIRKALSEATGPVEGIPPAWRATIGGRFLIKGVTSRRRLKTAKVFTPSITVRDNVVEEFLRVQSELSQLMLAADGYDLNQIRITSPVTRLIRMNLGDSFMVLTLHSQRHLDQADRVTATADFPASKSA